MLAEGRALTSGALSKKARWWWLAMSLQTPTMIQVLQRKLYRVAKEESTLRRWRLRSVLCSVCPTMKPVGEPDAGNPHVRFDERGWETERCRMAQATAPILDST